MPRLRARLPQPVDVAALRRRLGLSQDEFAERFGLAVSAVRDWKQKRRSPDRAAVTLSRVIERNPKAVEDALRA